MARIHGARGAQYLKVVEFAFNFHDSIIDTQGVEKSFGEKTGDAPVFVPIHLPRGAIVTGGEVVVEQVFNSSAAYSLQLGDATTPAKYLGTTSLKALGANALTINRAIQEGDLIATIANASASPLTTGRARIVVQFLQAGKEDEVVA
jgi:hypothetical protein